MVQAADSDVRAANHSPQIKEMLEAFPSPEDLKSIIVKYFERIMSTVKMI